MISRRRIISRSHEVLSDSQHNHSLFECEDNVWNCTDKLFRDHIQEILNKWEQIDDEIWSKIICMEKNRRVAKAYARAQVIAINGSDLDFDGYRIGLNGFHNPKRDFITEDVKKYIGSGAKLKIDDEGNVHIKRVGKSQVYVSANNLRMPDFGGQSNTFQLTAIDVDKSFKMFDIKKFQASIYKELRNSYPDRRKLEVQCVSCIQFVRQQHNILEHPIWVMLVNIVALDMLKSKFPTMPSLTMGLAPKFMTIYEHTVDEKIVPQHYRKHNDRYLTQSGHNSSGDSSLVSTSSSSSSALSTRKETQKVLQENDNYGQAHFRHRDDLYYCGLQARVPNYGRQRSSIAFCANNSSVDLRKYFNTSVQLSSLPPDLSDLSAHKNGSAEENLESLDMFAGRDSVRKKYASYYPNSGDHKYVKRQNVSRAFVGEWKEF